MDSIYIDEISIRNFKSFKKADVKIPQGFTCIIGRNACGKSNLVDGVCFALGENSLKHLRAKKASDLITYGTDNAEVKISLTKKDGERTARKYEVRRIVKKDGKVKYKFNGKNTTRKNVMSVLAAEGIRTDHNVIMQGEVESIIKMSPKERRVIIEQAAGIAEFEERKKEILVELGEVDGKINDVSILINEKRGALEELKRDRDDAINYKELKDKEIKLKATLIKSEYEKSEKEYSKVLNKQLELEKSMEEYYAEIKKLEQNLKILEEEKLRIDLEMRERGELKQIEMSRELENLKSTLSINKNKIEQTIQQINWIEGKINSTNNEIKSIVIETKKLENEIKNKKEEKIKLNEEFEKISFGLNNNLEINKKIKENKANLDELNNKLINLRGERYRIELEINNIKNGVIEKNNLINNFKEEKTFESTEKIKNEKKALEKELNELYAEERKLNNEIGTIENDYLDKKTKYAEILARYGTGVKDSPLNYINEQVKNKKLTGIEGSVGDLLEYDEDVALAIETAAGQRLNYVVTQNVESAINAIDALKKNKIGRLSFIPIDKIKYNAKTEADIALSKKSGVLGFAVDLIRFNPKYLPVFNYVFGNTLVIENTQVMREIGVGKVRMVTLGGELAEASGVMSGGKISRAVISQKKIDELKNEVEELLQKKKNIMSRIENIREELSEKRREIAEKDIKIKEIEIKGNYYNEQIMKRAAEKEKLETEVKEANKKLPTLEKNIVEIDSKIKNLEDNKEKLEERVNEAINNTQQSNEILSKSKDVEKNISNIEINIKNLESKLEEFEKRKYDKESELKSLKMENEKLKTDMDGTEVKNKEIEKDINEREKILGALSSKIREVLNKKTDLEQKIGELYNKKGKLDHEISKIKEEKARQDVLKATLETKLIDLKGEYGELKDITIIHGMDKQTIENELEKNKDELLKFQNVNMKAIEMYEEKDKELKKVEEKVEKLKEERGAVLRAIEDVEHKKSVVFMKSFESIAQNFSQIFQQVFKKPKNGRLILERTPGKSLFESGVSFVIEEGETKKHIISGSGGEKALLTLMFIFSILLTNPAPFYILDEVDAALDKENSKMLGEMLRKLSERTQIIAITHNDIVPTKANAVLGVVKTGEYAELVGVKIDQKQDQAVN